MKYSVLQNQNCIRKNHDQYLIDWYQLNAYVYNWIPECNNDPSPLFFKNELHTGLTSSYIYLPCVWKTRPNLCYKCLWKPLYCEKWSKSMDLGQCYIHMLYNTNTKSFSNVIKNCRKRFKLISNVLLTSKIQFMFLKNVLNCHSCSSFIHTTHMIATVTQVQRLKWPPVKYWQ